MALAEMTATDPHARLLAYSRESMYRVRDAQRQRIPPTSV